jgi:hypothetical protein
MNIIDGGNGLWYLTPLSTIFHLHVYRGGQFLLMKKSGDISVFNM